MKNDMMKFKKEDEIVYPGHGVAIIEEILEASENNEQKRYLKLKFKYKPMSILVPQEKIEELGIRFVNKENALIEILRELEKETDTKKNYRDNFAGGWSKRRKEYQLKLKSSNLVDVVTTYRDLQRYSEKKTLSFGEKGLMEIAEDLIYQEITTAIRMDKSEVLKKLRSPFKNNKKTLQL